MFKMVFSRTYVFTSKINKVYLIDSCFAVLMAQPITANFSSHLQWLSPTYEEIVVLTVLIGSYRVDLRKIKWGIQDLCIILFTQSSEFSASPVWTVIVLFFSHNLRNSRLVLCEPLSHTIEAGTPYTRKTFSSMHRTKFDEVAFRNDIFWKVIGDN